MSLDTGKILFNKVLVDLTKGVFGSGTVPKSRIEPSKNSKRRIKLARISTCVVSTGLVQYGRLLTLTTLQKHMRTTANDHRSNISYDLVPHNIHKWCPLYGHAYLSSLSVKAEGLSLRCDMICWTRKID